MKSGIEGLLFGVAQVHSDASGSSPFLVIKENKKLKLSLLGILSRDAPEQCAAAFVYVVPQIDVWSEFPMKKWVHVGWEV